MTDHIDGKAVELRAVNLETRFYKADAIQGAAMLRALLSERDALQAQLSAALAREGAVAMEVRARDLSCAMQVFSDAGCGCDDAENIAKAIRALPIPTDAAAALARREDGLRLVLYEVSKGPSPGEQMRHWIEHCMTLARAALKRSGKE